MPKEYQNDFEIGYNYARDRYIAYMTKFSSEYILELAKAFLFEKSSSAELSKGMGSYYLRIGIEKLLLESNAKRHSGKMHNNT